jgi:hypothetical protein
MVIMEAYIAWGPSGNTQLQGARAHGQPPCPDHVLPSHPSGGHRGTGAAKAMAADIPGAHQKP